MFIRASVLIREVNLELLAWREVRQAGKLGMNFEVFFPSIVKSGQEIIGTLSISSPFFQTALLKAVRVSSLTLPSNLAGDAHVVSESIGSRLIRGWSADENELVSMKFF